MDLSDTNSSASKMDQPGSFFHPTVISPNNNLPGGFYIVSPVPFAYEIHLFIKNYLPRKPARVIATIWLALTLTLGCIISALINFLFTIVWWLFRPFLPSNFFFYVLESSTSIIFGRLTQFALALNCFTVPIFEYRPPAPLPSNSEEEQETRWWNGSCNRSGNCSEASPCSNTSQLDCDDTSYIMDSTSSIGSTVSTSPSSTPCCKASHKASSLHRRRNRSFLSEKTKKLDLFRHSKRFSLDKIETASTESSEGSDLDAGMRRGVKDSTLNSEFVPRRTIIMANHLSNADGLLFAGISKGWPMKMIHKHDLNKVPCLGQCLITSRQIPVYFNSSKGMW